MAAALVALFLAFYEAKKTPRESHKLSERYCNSLFHFCVKYPESLLPYRELLPDSSGIGLQPFNRSALVTVRGDRTAAGRSPRAYFQEYQNTLASLQKPLNILDTLYGADYYEAYFTWQTESLFHQAFFFEDYCVIMIVRVPIDQPLLLKQIRSEVQLEFEQR